MNERTKSFADATKIMHEEYNNITRHNYTIKFLQSQILPVVIEINRCGVGEALEDLWDTIRNYSAQGFTIHLHEEDRVNYLSDSVVGLYWAQNSITQCATSLDIPEIICGTI